MVKTPHWCAIDLREKVSIYVHNKSSSLNTATLIRDYIEIDDIIL